jgi:hypothetical protein
MSKKSIGLIPMSRKQIVVVSVLVGGLLLLSGIAAASEDTVFNYGYDSENQLLVVNTTSWEDPDSDPECQFDTDLEDEAGTSYELEYTFGDTTEVADVSIGDADCELEAVEVTGPAGQVNHGMFIKAFNALYDGPRRGCVMRHIAQSDLGKDDQQIQADPDADPDFEPTETGTVEFFTALTDCENNGNGNGNGDEEASAFSNGNGKGQGRPDSPGKSGSAGQRP